MDILQEFSTALLQARHRKEATQEQVAWSLNVSQASYNAWECGHRLCPYKHITPNSLSCFPTNANNG